ncbi:Fc.00g086710.m01.CDS01 [Cosmosporella sp. VM-42]
MSSQGRMSFGDNHGHLDATTDREVVFCHACSHEWYRDEHGLECPECHSDATEIIELENDPRDLEHHSSASTSPEMPPLRYRDDDDSDPEEGDIDEHLGPHGFAFRRNVREGPDPRHHHHNPGVDPVVERFINMIHGFGPPRSANDGLFANPRERHDHEPTFGQPRIQRTTFTSGGFGGGTTSVTIVSGPLPGGRARSSPGGPQGDPFQAIFSNVLRDIGPPEDHPGARDNDGHGPPPGFARSLHEILSLISPANAMAGDAVYSQEALDRIITGLMEANPQSNAAPPATAEALKTLERKTVDKAMIGTDGPTECSICIDELKEGETAVYLPCKHFFHEACVVLWLQEHNTCPICRTPIEKNDGNNNNRRNDNPPSGDDSQPGRGPSGESQFPSPPSPGLGRHSAWFSTLPGNYGGPTQGDNSPQTRTFRYSRPPSQSQSRLNEALRNLSSIQRERERDRERDRASTSGFSYDTSRMQRRSSHSPTSPRAIEPGEVGARMRERSPSQSSRRSGADRDQRRPSGHGPISWLRDRFSGGSGGSSSRDGRRP